MSPLRGSCPTLHPDATIISPLRGFVLFVSLTIIVLTDPGLIMHFHPHILPHPSLLLLPCVAVAPYMRLSCARSGSISIINDGLTNFPIILTLHFIRARPNGVQPGGHQKFSHLHIFRVSFGLTTSHKTKTGIFFAMLSTR